MHPRANEHWTAVKMLLTRQFLNILTSARSDKTAKQATELPEVSIHEPRKVEFTFTFSHFADAFIRLTIGEYITRLILKRQTNRGSARDTKSQALFK